MIEVKSGPANNCECGSWLKHWNRCTGQIGWYCTVENCTNLASDAGHVTMGKNPKQYVVPLCDIHNVPHTSLVLEPNTTLVGADKEITCQKLNKKRNGQGTSAREQQ